MSSQLQELSGSQSRAYEHPNTIGLDDANDATEVQGPLTIDIGSLPFQHILPQVSPKIFIFRQLVITTDYETYAVYQLLVTIAGRWHYFAEGFVSFESPILLEGRHSLPQDSSDQNMAADIEADDSHGIVSLFEDVGFSLEVSVDLLFKDNTLVASIILRSSARGHAGCAHFQAKLERVWPIQPSHHLEANLSSGLSVGAVAPSPKHTLVLPFSRTLTSASGHTPNLADSGGSNHGSLSIEEPTTLIREGPAGADNLFTSSPSLVSELNAAIEDSSLGRSDFRTFCTCLQHLTRSNPLGSCIGWKKNTIPAWKPGTHLTFHLDELTFPEEHRSLAKQALGDAITSWGNELGVQLEQVYTAKEAIVTVRYTTEKPQTRGTLAIAFLPGDEPYEIKVFPLALNQPRDGLSGIFAHEIGHVLGLRHEDAVEREIKHPAVRWTKFLPGSIMMPTHNDYTKARVQPEDIAAVKALIEFQGQEFAGLRIIRYPEETPQECKVATTVPDISHGSCSNEQLIPPNHHFTPYSLLPGQHQEGERIPTSRWWSRPPIRPRPRKQRKPQAKAFLITTRAMISRFCRSMSCGMLNEE